MDSNVFLIAQQINADIGVTPYDELNIWRAQYYSNNALYQNTPSPTVDHSTYLFAQINAANFTALSRNDFSLSTPVAYSNPAYPSVNTQITLTPGMLTGYTGTLTVSYMRFDITTLLSPQTVSITPASTALMLSDILPQINAAYGADLLASDIVDVTLPMTTVINGVAQPAPVVIAIAASSLKYTGIYTFILNYVNTLSGASSNPALSGSSALLFYNVTSGSIAPSGQAFLMNLDNTVNTGFSLGHNLNSYSQFQVNAIGQGRSIYVESTQQLYLDGNFNIAFTNNLTQTSGSFNMLVVDSTGAIIQGLTQALFALNSGFEWAVNRDPNFQYSLNSAGAPGSGSLNRYTASGTIDLAYNPVLNYAPFAAFSQGSGNVYVVSNTYSGVSPYSVSGVSQNLIRIDRLLSTGVVDATFNPVYLSASMVNNAICVVTDILETSTGLIQILVAESTGYDVGSNVPVVNAVPIVSINSNAGSQVVWSPIISLLSNGQKNTAFNNTLNIFSGNAISISPTAIAGPMLNLNFYGGMTVFWSNVKNPINGLSTYLPLRFDSFGNMVFYSSTEYQNMLVYANVFPMQTYSDGSYLVAGELASVNIGGALSAVRTIVSLYGPDGTVQPIAPGVVAGQSSNSVGILNVIPF